MTSSARLGIFTPATARGGSEEYVIAAARRARGIYAHVSVYLPDVSDVQSVREELEAEGVSVGTIDAPYAEPFSEAEHLAAFHDAWQVLERERFDHLLIVLPGIEFGGPLIDAAVSFDQPTVVLYQLAGYDHYLSTVERQFYTWARRGRQRWLTVSTDNRDRLCRNLGWDTSAIEVFPNGLLREPEPLTPDDTRRYREVLRSKLGVAPDAQICLTVARLDPQKGVERLLDAAVRASTIAPSLHFVWAGDGRLAADTRATLSARGLNGRVHLLGRRQDVGQLLAAADLFTLPSHFEGRPFAAMEAMAAGLPCVLSDIGPHRDLAANGGALLIDAGNASAYAELLCSISQDKQQATSVGRQARLAATAFSADAYFDRLFTYLGSTTEERTASGDALWPLSPSSPRERIAIFGTGEGGRRALDELAPFADVRAFVDGQADRTGKTVKGRPVVSAADVRAIGCDRIVLASCWYGSMQDELRRVGVRDSQIDVFPQWRLSLPRQKFTSSLTSV